MATGGAWQILNLRQLLYVTRNLGPNFLCRYAYSTLY
jgi:hypothetical protein